MSIYLSNLAIINALGSGREAILENLLRGEQSGMHACGPLLTGRSGIVGRVAGEFAALPPDLAEYDCRNNRLLAATATQLESAIDAHKSRFGPSRIVGCLSHVRAGASGQRCRDRNSRRTGGCRSRAGANRLHQPARDCHDQKRQDGELPAIGLTGDDAHWKRGVFMSNSFAFGGSNVSVIIGRE